MLSAASQGEQCAKCSCHAFFRIHHHGCSLFLHQTAFRCSSAAKRRKPSHRASNSRCSVSDCAEQRRTFGLDKEVDIYNPAYVQDLFDRVSSTYGFTNYIASFGFTERWRKACITRLGSLPSNAVGCDLMCGRGETWR